MEVLQIIGIIKAKWEFDKQQGMPKTRKRVGPFYFKFFSILSEKIGDIYE
ncbi:hypothetical protein [Chitinophaga nivalis]|uniref:Uncharacterized protein n=1 Tax=Chitinophaga nivalis TaxID=2991709 RepID=A0ABT3IQH4_9BACT|nr:hypothetical protein [Chitinophaga nivalis]MCW3464117.1 hypothetical protein [Chitinophaga nivalis]MCW3486193.1 hypothetical protein [Chitinophaga nivalis]